MSVELAEIDLEKNHQMTLRLLSGLEAGRFNMAFKDQICNFFGSMPDHGELYIPHTILHAC